jgi:hypothetical protein
LRSKLGGLAIILAAPVMVIYLFIKIIGATDDFRWWMVGFVFLGLGWLALHSLGKSLRAPDAAEAMERDPRPPVVYLRPFRADERTTEDAPRGEREGGEHVTVHSSSASRENTISRALASVGPFVAVGKPGESIAPWGGAARVYLSDENWKEVVESLVRRAAAVVLQPEPSEGTLWEVKLVASAVDRRRVLLLVPNPRLRPFGYNRVRQLIAEKFGVELPEQAECPACDAFSFDGQGRPAPVSLPQDSSADLAPFAKLVSELGRPAQESG